MVETKHSPSGELINTQMIYAHSIAALVTLLFSVLFGIVISLQFVAPELTGDTLALGWGRLRYAHTQGIMLGWLGNAFIAFLYHAVPVLTQRQVSSPKLGRYIFGIWNFIVVVPGWILVLGGVSQPLEWAEFPMIIDAFVILAFAMLAIQFLPPFFRDGLENLYVSSWYIIGGLVFTLLAFPMGNFVPEMVSGATSAAFGGLWIHDAVGLFVTPMALAIIYFVIPAASGRPIYSHFLSMLGFWGLFFLYPLNGTHHYIFSVIPMEAQVGAIVASGLLGLIVLVVVTNLFLSLRGSGILPKDIGLRFVAVGIIFYLIVSVQGALQAQMSLNQTVHFTDWVVAHSHMAMLGFATFAGIGGIIHAWQRIPWVKYNASAINWSFWLLFAGISIMVIDLTIAGIIEAHLWQSGAPWLESVQAAKPYWIIRILSAIPITAGFIALFIGLTSGPVGAGMLTLQENSQAMNREVLPVLNEEEATTKPSGALSMSYLVASVAGVGFFGFSVILLGVWPGKVLDAQIAATSPENLMSPSASEQRGRMIYAREGCGYCHTQQIRYLEADIKQFGAPTLAWETQFDIPHLWGTRRIGPDLSREGSVRSADWQYAHLFSPRSVVPLSIMPAYSAFFDGAATKPTQEARDLVAYIESLGRARELAGPEGDAAAAAVLKNNKWAQMSFDAPFLNGHAAKAQPGGNFPDLETVISSGKGKQLWQDHCASCHGQQGRGNGLAASSLSPQPTNLVEHEYTLARISDVLFNGIEGTSMPAWRDQTPEDLLAVAEYVREFYEPVEQPQFTNEILSLGAQVFSNNCTQCHGENGDGAGFAANEFSTLPANFQVQRPSIRESLRVLTNGRAGTAMVPWGDRINENEMLAVTHYLRQLYIPDVNNDN